MAKVYRTTLTANVVACDWSQPSTKPRVPYSPPAMPSSEHRWQSRACLSWRGAACSRSRLQSCLCVLARPSGRPNVGVSRIDNSDESEHPSVTRGPPPPLGRRQGSSLTAGCIPDREAKGVPEGLDVMAGLDRRAAFAHLLRRRARCGRLAGNLSGMPRSITLLFARIAATGPCRTPQCLVRCCFMSAGSRSVCGTPTPSSRSAITEQARRRRPWRTFCRPARLANWFPRRRRRTVGRPPCR